MATGRLVVKIRRSDPEVSKPILNNLQRQIYRDFLQKFQRLQANLNPKADRAGRHPAGASSASSSATAVAFSCRSTRAWTSGSARGRERFVSELRAVDPEVTGTPIITYEAITLMERAYRQGTLYAVLLVIGVTFAMLRRVRRPRWPSFPSPSA